MNLSSESRGDLPLSRMPAPRRFWPAWWTALAGWAVLSLVSACTLPDPLEGLDAAATTQSATHANQGMTRIIDLPRASVVLPPGWSSGAHETWPVFVVLHGWSQNGALMARGPVWSGLALRLPAVMVFPVSGGSGGWEESPDSPDRQLVVSLLTSLRHKSWTKPASIILFGWSAGSVLASDILGANQDGNPGPLADRIIMYSGFMGYWLERSVADKPGLPSLPRIPVLLINGRKEGQDDLGRMESLLKDLGFDFATLTHPDAHSLRDDMVEAAASWAVGKR